MLSRNMKTQSQIQEWLREFLPDVGAFITPNQRLRQSGDMWEKLKVIIRTLMHPKQMLLLTVGLCLGTIPYKVYTGALQRYCFKP